MITTERLTLVPLTRAYLAALLTRAPRPDLGFGDPYGFLDGADDVVELRLRQVEADPAVEPWLLRAIVIDERAIGHVGGHAAPDSSGRFEIGYEVLREFRRQGYAREAVTALIAWAAEHGARIVRASIAPDNTASLAMVAALGFTHVGEQIDDVDGRELVYERPTSS